MGGSWGGNPWWWWGAATLATAGTFLAIDAIQAATDQPPVYDYGVNVVYQGDYVYVDGKQTASATGYSNQAIALASEPAANLPHPGHRNQASNRTGCLLESGLLHKRRKAMLTCFSSFRLIRMGW